MGYMRSMTSDQIRSKINDQFGTSDQVPFHVVPLKVQVPQGQDPKDGGHTQVRACLCRAQPQAVRDPGASDERRCRRQRERG